MPFTILRFAEIPLASTRIVNDPTSEELIKWSENGDSFYGRFFVHRALISVRLFSPSSVTDPPPLLLP